MADNDNLNQDQNQEQDPFAHPVKRTNWWLYIFGTMVMVGIIIWFFVDWSYKDRDKHDLPVTEEAYTPVPDTQATQTLPAVSVEGVEGGQPDSIQ